MKAGSRSRTAPWMVGWEAPKTAASARSVMFFRGAVSTASTR